MRHRFARTWRVAASTLVVSTAVLVLGAVTPRSASATVTYQYTGSRYAIALFPYDTNMRIEGTITLESPLPKDAPFQDISISAYDFTDGVLSYAYAAPLPDGISGAVRTQTDASGAIVGWLVHVRGGSGPPPCGCGSSTYNLVTQNPGVMSVPPVFDYILIEEFNGGVHVDARTEAPGAWTLVPEPSALMLLASGVSALAAVRRRR